MTPVNWIPIEAPGALGITPRPRGGDWLVDEVRAWRSAGVNRVVSALEPLEEAVLELEEESAECKRLGIVFERFRVMDRSTPAGNEANYNFVLKLAERLTDGESIVVHCRLGIGRSGMLCAATLVALGLDSSEAFLRVSTARGLQVPDTRQQIEWVQTFERWRLQ